MKPRFFIILIILLIYFLSPDDIYAQYITTVGQCHGTNLLNRQEVTWAYDGGTPSIWKNIEPQRGVFNFSGLDEIVSNAKSLGKKVWIQVLTDNPGVETIPQWALDAGMGQLPDRYNASLYRKDRPTQWDPLYHQFLREVLQAMNERYGNEEAVEAILMMSGGHYGEMVLHPRYYKWDANPDVKDPNNPYVKEMARVTGESAETITQTYNDFFAKFDYYYLENTKRLIDLYVQSFPNKPVVLQVGSGLSGDFNKIAIGAVDYAVNTYGKRVWLKQNGWGNWPGCDAYCGLFSRYKTRTRITREVGHVNLWENNQAHNEEVINAAINGGASALCFQSDFFTRNSSFPGVNFSYIAPRLENNYRQYYANIPTIPLPSFPPTSTLAPTRLPSEGPCSKKRNGDANCDNQIDEKDYQILRCEFLGDGKCNDLSAVKTADFNNDSVVNLIDFEIWRINNYAR